MKITDAVVVLVILFKTSSAQYYVVIKRQAQDIVVYSRSWCKVETIDIILNQCNGMHGNLMFDHGKPVDCTCQCNSVNTNIVGFIDNRWRCESNSDVRRKAGCSVLYIHPNTASSPFKVVPDSKNLLRKTGSIYTNPAKMCTLQDHFSYLDCHGIWRQTNHSGAIFTFARVTSNSYDLYFKMGGYKTLGQYNPPLYGRVIKLNIRCTSPTVKYYCVVLKVQGQPKCTITIQTRTTAKLPAPQPTTAKLPLPPPSSCKTTDVVCHISESLPTIQPFQITDKKNVRTADNCGMIAGTAVGVATLIGVIIVIIFFKKIKMKRSESPSEREDSSRFYDDIYDEPLDNTFTHAGQLSSNDKQYDYAYADVVLNQDRAIFQISATNDPTYDQCLPVPEDPVNNTLEDTDSMKPVPMRNVLDGPGNEESSYDVVGGIIFKDPVNDVIEELGV